MHRVGRVLSFFSSRRNWGSHTSSPEQASVTLSLPLGSGGEGVGEFQFRRGDRHCGTLGIYVLVHQCNRLGLVLHAGAIMSNYRYLHNTVINCPVLLYGLRKIHVDYPILCCIIL
jgi:hypothetical protein